MQDNHLRIFRSDNGNAYRYVAVYTWQQEMAKQFSQARICKDPELKSLDLYIKKMYVRMLKLKIHVDSDKDVDVSASEKLDIRICIIF